MPHPDTLSERFNFWILILIGLIALILYQSLQIPFALEYIGEDGFLPRSAGWISLGIMFAALMGIVLPLSYLSWSQRISFRSQFMLSPVRPGTGLAVIAATLSLIPALEILTYEASRWVPPSEGYLKFLRSMQTAEGLGTVAMVLSLAFIVPFAEELLFRGLLQRSVLTRVAGPWAEQRPWRRFWLPISLWRRIARPYSAILVAVLFGVVHPPYSIPGVILLGIYFGILALLLDNLYYPIIAHAVWNLANVIVLKLTPMDLESAPASPFQENALLWFLVSAMLFVFFSRFWFQARMGKKNPQLEVWGN